MKKFYFSLENILKYKGQILENLRNEHGQLLQKVVKKEQCIEALEVKSQTCSREFDVSKTQGKTIQEIRMYENYLFGLQENIEKEKVHLDMLKQSEAAKRAEVVEANKETRSIEKLKEKKQKKYDKEVEKSEEQFIEEFVSHKRSVAG